MANNKFTLQFAHGAFPYAVIRNQAGNFARQDTLVFEAFNSADWTTSKYCIFGIEVGDTGIFDFTFPALAALGSSPFDVLTFFAPSSNSPTIPTNENQDPSAGASFSAYWDGTNITSQVAYAASSLFPSGIGQTLVSNNPNCSPAPISGISSKFISVINYPFVGNLVLPGIDSVGWTEMNFCVKSSALAVDSQATLLIKVSNPASGTDGLITLNGVSSPPTPASASDGAIVVNGVTGNTTLSISTTALGASSISPGSYYFSCTRYIGSAKFLLAVGTIEFRASVLDAISAP